MRELNTFLVCMWFRLEDGVVLDERVFCNDYINLAHSMGVFLFDDLLAIVSLRYQRIHILQIRDSGSLVDVRAIGEFCREDDELFLSSTAQASTSSLVLTFLVAFWMNLTNFLVKMMKSFYLKLRNFLYAAGYVEC